MAVPLDDRPTKLRIDTIADRLVLAYLGRLARAGCMTRSTANSGGTRAIDDRNINEEVALSQPRQLTV